MYLQSNQGLLFTSRSRAVGYWCINFWTWWFRGSVQREATGARYAKRAERRIQARISKKDQRPGVRDCEVETWTGGTQSKTRWVCIHFDHVNFAHVAFALQEKKEPLALNWGRSAQIVSCLPLLIMLDFHVAWFSCTAETEIYEQSFICLSYSRQQKYKCENDSNVILSNEDGTLPEKPYDESQLVHVKTYVKSDRYKKMMSMHFFKDNLEWWSAIKAMLSTDEHMELVTNCFNYIR